MLCIFIVLTVLQGNKNVFPAIFLSSGEPLECLKQNAHPSKIKNKAFLRFVLDPFYALKIEDPYKVFAYMGYTYQYLLYLTLKLRL